MTLLTLLPTGWNELFALSLGLVLLGMRMVPSKRRWMMSRSMTSFLEAGSHLVSACASLRMRFGRPALSASLNLKYAVMSSASLL